MKATTRSATVLLASCLALVACGPGGVSGSGVVSSLPSSGATTDAADDPELSGLTISPAPAPSVTTTAASLTSAVGSGEAGPGGAVPAGASESPVPPPAPGGGTDRPAAPAPTIDHAAVECVLVDEVYLPVLTWTISHAEGVVVTTNGADRRDLPGRTGSVQLAHTGCYAEFGLLRYQVETIGHDHRHHPAVTHLEHTGVHHWEGAPESPRFDEHVLTCTETAPGEWTLTLDYTVSNADGMALSINNPGVVGAFGSYPPFGSVELPPNGCYASYGEQVYHLVSVGGFGAPVTVELRRTGEH